MSEKRSIPVRILGQEYRVRSGADETIVRGAATLVDETMQRIQQHTGTVDTRDLAVLAAAVDRQQAALASVEQDLHDVR